MSGPGREAEALGPELDFPAIVRGLSRNAEVFRDLVSAVSDEQARWKPDPTQWSILEVVSHLADEEVEDFRARVHSTLRQPEERWSPIDPEGWAAARRYGEGDLGESLQRFLAARAESIAWLGELTDPDWTLAYHHPELGPIRAGDLMTAWVAHDHIHIRQLNRLHRAFLVSRTSGFSPTYAGRW